jgi:hypothetical protein
LSITNRTCIDNGPERQLLDDVNKDLVPVTVLEVEQGFVLHRREVAMVKQFDNRKVLGFSLDGLREQGYRISG